MAKRDSETRGGVAVEVRTTESGGIKVSGYVAVYNQRADIGGYFTESFERGAFSKAVKEDDVLLLVNHRGLPLARTKSGTLKLIDDDHGVKIESSLDPDDPDVKQIIPKVKRGDMNQMSVGFFAVRQEWDESGDVPHRTIFEATMFDASIVPEPAYAGTDFALRSLEGQRETNTSTQNFKAAQKRKRRMDLRLKATQ